MFSNLFFEYRVVYVIRWKNTAEPDKPKMTIRCMRFANLITTVTDKHIVCNTYCFATATRAVRTRLNVTLNVQCLSLFSLTSSTYSP